MATTVKMFGSHIEDLRESPIELIKWKLAEGDDHGVITLKKAVLAASVGTRDVLLEADTLKVTLYDVLDKDKLKNEN